MNLFCAKKYDKIRLENKNALNVKTFGFIPSL